MADEIVPREVGIALQDADWLLQWLAAETCESEDPDLLCNREVCQETGCVSDKRARVRKAIAVLAARDEPDA